MKMNFKKIFVSGFVFLIVCCFLASPVHANVITEGSAYPFNGSWLGGEGYDGGISVGYSGGTGSLTVNTETSGNALTTATAAYLNIGSGEGGAGTVTVEGDGTSGSAQITTTSEYAIYTGLGGLASLTITDGGIVEANEGNIYLGTQGLADTAGTAMTTIDGEGSILSAQQGSEEEYYWERDGGRISVGFDGQSISVVNITNGGTMEALGGSGTVGDTADFGAIYIGSSADSGSTAIVNVDGEGSTVKADNYIWVGNDVSNVTAQLNITNGADVEVTNGYALNGEATDTDMDVSAFPVDSEASVTVNGSGSTLTVDELQIGGKQTIVGYTEDGTPVAVYDDDDPVVGEQVTDKDGNLLYDSDRNPILYVNDEIFSGFFYTLPSTWTDGNQIYVKNSGSVIVENGAEMLTTTVNISENNSNATAYNEQYASLTVRDEGVVYGNINVYEDGILNGDGTIVGNVNVEGGTVAPGNSPGTLTIDGDFIVDSGILEIEVASLTSYDIFDVSGDTYIGEDALIDITLGSLDIDTIDITNFFTGSGSLTFDDEFDPLTDIVLSILGLNGGDTYSVDLIFYDHIYTYAESGVSIGQGTSPAPEPSTMFLFCAGLIGIAGIRRKLK